MKRLVPVALFAAALSYAPVRADEPRAGAIDFNRHIRPILSDNCFSCHGPDEQQRKAKLRLDTRDGALAALRRGGHAVVPGKPETSAIIERVLAEDPSERMPPERTQKRVTREQAELLKRWIEQGAPYAQHWAFVPPRRPELPKVGQREWVRNPGPPT